MNTTKQAEQWVCTSCGSPDVLADAYVHLNDPDDVRTFDSTFCENCEGETNAVQRPIPPYTQGQTVRALLNPPGVGTCLGEATITAITPQQGTGGWRVDYRNTDASDPHAYGDAITKTGTSDYIATPPWKPFNEDKATK